MPDERSRVEQRVERMMLQFNKLFDQLKKAEGAKKAQIETRMRELTASIEVAKLEAQALQLKRSGGVNIAVPHAKFQIAKAPVAADTE